MQDEQSWMASQDAEESMAKERYEYFTRPEPRDNMSDIYYEEDEYLGTAKCRDLRIGMVRNAAEDNKKVVKAYLEPFPHIRIDDAKALQGWYKGLHEGPNVRPRPCLLGGSLVNTPVGSVSIEQIKVGDSVMGWDFSAGAAVVATVEGVASPEKNEYIEVELESGEVLKLTPEHLVYTNNRGWIEAGTLTIDDDILELR